jgi:hypothetical protein
MAHLSPLRATATKIGSTTMTALLGKWDAWHKHHEGVVSAAVIAAVLACYAWWGVATYEMPTFHCGPIPTYERNAAGEIVLSPKQHWGCTYSIAHR